MNIRHLPIICTNYFSLAGNNAIGKNAIAEQTGQSLLQFLFQHGVEEDDISLINLHPEVAQTVKHLRPNLNLICILFVPVDYFRLWQAGIGELRIKII